MCFAGLLQTVSYQLAGNVLRRNLADSLLGICRKCASQDSCRMLLNLSNDLYVLENDLYVLAKVMQTH